MNRDTGIVSHALSGRSLPVIQWIGASKCVPVCSPIRIVFQYQAGPFSSYFEITSIVMPGDGANIGGRPITGVVGPERLRQIDHSQRAAIQFVDQSIHTPLMKFASGGFAPPIADGVVATAPMAAADFLPAIHRLNRKAFSGSWRSMP